MHSACIWLDGVNRPAIIRFHTGRKGDRLMSLRSDADKIIEESLHTVLPDQAVKRALKNYAAGEGRIALIAAGKAEW